MKTPVFPQPDANDPEPVAKGLKTAATLWAAGRPQEALLQLIRAAALKDGPKSDRRSIELAAAASELADYVHRGDDPRSIPISLDFGIGESDAQSIQVQSSEIEVVESGGPAPSPGRPPPVKRIALDQTLPQGHKLEGAPTDWPFLKKKKTTEPAAVPGSQTLKDAPITTPEVDDDDPHGAPTRRMEDIETRRDPHDPHDPHEKKKP